MSPALPAAVGAIPVDSGDVKIVRIHQLDCSECDKPATHQVWLDLRNCGTDMVVSDELCSEHAADFAGRLRASLPREVPE